MKKATAIALVLVVLIGGGVVYAASKWDDHDRDDLIAEIEARDALLGEQLVSEVAALERRAAEQEALIARLCDPEDGGSRPNGCPEPTATATPSPTATPTPETTPAPTRHWHCERIINDGYRCDRRYRPGVCWHSHVVDSNHTWRSSTLRC